MGQLGRLKCRLFGCKPGWEYHLDTGEYKRFCWRGMHYLPQMLIARVPVNKLTQDTIYRDVLSYPEHVERVIPPRAELRLDKPKEL